MVNKKLLTVLAIFLIPTVFALILLQVQTTVTITPGIEFIGENAEDVEIPGGEHFTSNILKIVSATSVIAPIDIVTEHTIECEVEDTENFLLDNSEGTCDNYPDEGWRNECEKRLAFNGMALSDFNSMSWDVNVIEGYVSHVDLILDNGEALTIEYATFDSDCNVPSSYPEGEYVFNINENTYAWESLPGPCGDENFEAQHNTLTEWKATYPTAIITRFELEIDNWIEASNSEVKNILINGNSIEVTLLPGDELSFNVESEYPLLCEGEDTVTTTIVERI